MPAEWEPHDATWIAWPHNRADWPGKFSSIPWVYAEIVRQLQQAERVHILIDDAASDRRVRRVLLRAGLDLHQTRKRPPGCDRLALQRLGQVSQLAKG
jgi:agmatine deiminase